MFLMDDGAAILLTWIVILITIGAAFGLFFLIKRNIKMDKEEHTAYVNDEELSLTVREFNILFEMLSSPKKTFTRSKLMEEFWDYDSSATSRTVDVYMAKLRDKTKECDGFEIQTVHGLGYKVILK